MFTFFYYACNSRAWKQFRCLRLSLIGDLRGSTATSALVSKTENLHWSSKDWKFQWKIRCTIVISGIQRTSRCTWPSQLLTDFVFPEGPLRLTWMQESHDCLTAGHPGRDRTHSKLARHFYWPNVGKDAKDLLSHAISVKGAREDADGRIAAQSLPVPSHPWEDIIMDMIVHVVYHQRKVVRTQFLRLCIISPKWFILYLGLPLWMPEEQHSFIWTMFLWSTGLANPLCQIVIPDSLLPSGRSCLPCLERN